MSDNANVYKENIPKFNHSLHFLQLDISQVRAMKVIFLVFVIVGAYAVPLPTSETGHEVPIRLPRPDDDLVFWPNPFPRPESPGLESEEEVHYPDPMPEPESPIKVTWPEDGSIYWPFPDRPIKFPGPEDGVEIGPNPFPTPEPPAKDTEDDVHHPDPVPEPENPIKIPEPEDGSIFWPFPDRPIKFPGPEDGVVIGPNPFPLPDPEYPIRLLQPDEDIVYWPNPFPEDH